MARSNRPPQNKSNGDASEVTSALLRLIPLFVFGSLALYIAWNGFYTVGASEQVVVLRMGRYQTTNGPGLHFMVPWFDEILRVDTRDHTLRLPFTDNDGSQRASSVNEIEGLMLTGELNAAVVEWDVIYRVRNPQQFLFQISEDDLEAVIRAASQSVMHRLMGDYSIDEVLTSERETIQAAALKELQETLNKYESGVEIASLQLQRVTPPESVKTAYDQVNEALQTKEQLVNEAQKQRNMLLPQAQAARDGSIRQAEGDADRRKQEADGQLSALRSQFEAYSRAPEITRLRMYVETMQLVLQQSGPKLILDQNLERLVPLLNLGTEGAVRRTAPDPQQP